jgi:ABC-type branched-subunit amino acid transport system substrate-binding protein
MSIIARMARWAGAACVGLAIASGASAQGAKPPIRIGSTLALTGPLAATSLIHKVVGEIYVDQLNQRGGLLGRPVEWIVKDDQSKPDLARTLYEQLITTDKVDLLMGPYATGAILSAMGVAQRYHKVLIHHTFGIPAMAKYDMQFPAWSLGPDPGTTVPTTVLKALAASPKPPKTIAIVTSKFPSVHPISCGSAPSVSKATSCSRRCTRSITRRTSISTCIRRRARWPSRRSPTTRCR